MLLVQQEVDPGEGRLEEAAFIGIERGGELVGEAEGRGSDGVVALVHVHQARRRLGMPLIGAEGGVAEPLHVAQGVPNLDDRHADAVVQKADDDAIGVQHHGTARRNVVDLADHLDQVGGWIAQLLGKDHRVPRWISALAIVLDELEIDRRAIALPTDAHDAPALGHQRAEGVEHGKRASCKGYDNSTHESPLYFTILLADDTVRSEGCQRFEKHFVTSAIKVKAHSTLSCPS